MNGKQLCMLAKALSSTVKMNTKILFINLMFHQYISKEEGICDYYLYALQSS